MSNVPARSLPGVFLLLTVAWSWACWWGAAATGREWTEPLPLALFLAGGVGPLLVATALVRSGRYDAPPREFWRRFVRWRVGPWWAAAIVAAAFAPALLARLLVTGNGDDDATGVGVVAGVLVVAIIAGIAEEPGWRGYALDGLARRWPVVAAALAVGLVHAGWHLPLYLIEGTFHSDLGFSAEGILVTPAGAFATGVVYAWIYFGTGRSIFAVIAFHSLANLAGETVSPGGAAARAIEVAMFAGISAAVVLLRTRAMLSRTPPDGPGWD
jgi:uncharacterized protein